MLKILYFTILSTFFGFFLLHAEDNKTSQGMMETTEPYWAISFNQEILNSQKSFLPNQGILWGLSLDSDDFDDTVWESLIEKVSDLENSKSFITEISQATEGDSAEYWVVSQEIGNLEPLIAAAIQTTEGDSAEYWAVSQEIGNLEPLIAAAIQANKYPKFDAIPPKLLEAINSQSASWAGSLEWNQSLSEKRQECILEGNSYNECFGNFSSNENPYSSLINNSNFNLSNHLGGRSATESIGNSLTYDR